MDYFFIIQQFFLFFGFQRPHMLIFFTCHVVLTHGGGRTFRPELFYLLESVSFLMSLFSSWYCFQYFYLIFKNSIQGSDCCLKTDCYCSLLKISQWTTAQRTVRIQFCLFVGCFFFLMRLFAYINVLYFARSVQTTSFNLFKQSQLVHFPDIYLLALNGKEKFAERSYHGILKSAFMLRVNKESFFVFM